MGRQTLLISGRRAIAWGLAALLLTAAVARPEITGKKADSRLRLIPIVTDQRIEDIQESPDGTRLLTHDRGFAPRLWDAKSMRLIAVLGGSPVQFIHEVEMSQDGSRIVTASVEHIRLWDVKTARLIAEWKSEAGARFLRFGLASNGSWLVVGDDKGQVWYIEGKPESKPILLGKHEQPAKSTDGTFRDIAVSPDGTVAASAGLNPTVMVWSIKEKKAIQTLPAPPGGVGWLEISRDNRQIIVTGFDGKARLWNIETGKMQFEWEHFVGDKSGANTLMGAIFVGKTLDEVLVAGKTGTMTIYDRNSGKLLRKLEGYVRAIREIRKTRDGLRVATYADEDDIGGREPLKLWNVETTKEYAFKRGHTSPTAGAFSPDGRFFWVGYGDGSIRRHELETGKIYTETISAVNTFDGLYPLGNSGRYYYKRSAFEGLSRQTTCTTFDPNNPGGTSVYTVEDLFMDASPSGKLVIGKAYFKDKEGKDKETHAVWNIATEKSVWLFWDACEELAWGGNEYIIAWGDTAAVVFDMAEPAFKQYVYEGPTKVGLAKLSPDNRWAMVMDVDCKVHIVGVGDNKKKFDIGTTGGVFKNQFAFTHDSKHLVVLKENNFEFIELESGKVERKVPCPFELEDNQERPINEEFFVTKDGSTIVVYGQLLTCFIDATTGKERLRAKTYNNISSNSLESFLSPDEKLFATHMEGSVGVFDTATGKQIARLNITDTVTGVCFANEGKRLIITDATDQATIWDTTVTIPSKNPQEPQTLKRLGSFVTMHDGSWLVMDSDGRYDASDPSNVTGASYVLEWDGGLEPIDVQQLKSLFYEPGLLAKLLGTNKEPLRTVPDLSTIKLYPTITLAKSEKNPNRIEVNLAERDGGGIGSVRVLINGKEIMYRKGTGFFNVDVSQYQQYFLPAARLGEGNSNVLQVIATNASGDLTSRAETIELGIPEGLRTPDVNLYGLFVGVGDYVGNKRDLKAPPSDAMKLGEAIEKTGARLLPNRVHITEMTTESKDENLRPTRQSILKWFNETSKKATSSDIIIVFFAGHGTSAIGDKRGYFFLTADADPSEVTPAIVSTATITGEDLQRELASIPACKQVIILDTCHSGAAADRLLQSDRSVSSDFARAYESIKDGSGTWLLAGAAADQLSYESNNVDHGMLTYSLLEAIDRASADGLRSGSGGDLFVDVERWLKYAANRVDSLKNEVGLSGVQRPEFKRSRAGNSFDLGVTRVENRGELGLKPPMPIVIMGTFQQDEEDPINLESAVSGALRDSTTIKLWTDISKHPNVYRVAGSYTYDKASHAVTLRLAIQKFDSQQARKTLETIQITGDSTKLAELAKTVKQKVEESIKKAEKG